MTDDQISDLAERLSRGRERLRIMDREHPAILDVGYALKAVAQWRSLDEPPAQRPSVTRELRAAAESCGQALNDDELRWLATEEAFDVSPAR